MADSSSISGEVGPTDVWDEPAADQLTMRFSSSPVAGAAPTAVLRVVTPEPVVDAAEDPSAVVGEGRRGRILTIEGAHAGARASVLLADIAPQTLLAAEQVDAVHLPSASDLETVLAHLRAAARHPGPLLLHLAGRLGVERPGGGLALMLRGSDGLAWRSVAEELRSRPAGLDTLVLADLGADPDVRPLVRGTPSPLAAGLPLWAVVNPDAEPPGAFTSALVEAVRAGRPGAGPLLTPERLRERVDAALPTDALVVTEYGPERPIFRNTAGGATGGAAVRLAKADAPVPPAGAVRPRSSAEGEQVTARTDYREAIGRIVRTADAGEHATAAELARVLEREAADAHGPAAEAVLMIRQVRAHVTRLAGEPAGAAELYREVALVLLAERGPDDPETQQAATNAEACWRAVRDRDQAIGLAPELLELRALLPGPDGRKLRSAQRYLARLTAAE
ncbi:hypothetical protein ACIGXM_18445 [Kitasatospora sp. NPDC052896]|uniref:hypothetical protein n=1 Tax=Kitasatospora sp. NPDC052896 TaxID=3364061 RepID=UPI0037C87A05